MTCHRKHFLRDVPEEAAEVDFCCLTLGFLLATMENGFVWTDLQEGVLVLQLLVSRGVRPELVPLNLKRVVCRRRQKLERVHLPISAIRLPFDLQEKRHQCQADGVLPVRPHLLLIVLSFSCEVRDFRLEVSSFVLSFVANHLTQ